MLSYPNPQQLAAAEMMQRAAYAANQNHRQPPSQPTQQQQQSQQPTQQHQQQNRDVSGIRDCRTSGSSDVIERENKTLDESLVDVNESEVESDAPSDGEELHLNHHQSDKDEHVVSRLLDKDEKENQDKPPADREKTKLLDPPDHPSPDGDEDDEDCWNDENINDEENSLDCESVSCVQTEIKSQRPLGLLAQHGMTTNRVGLPKMTTSESGESIRRDDADGGVHMEEGDRRNFRPNGMLSDKRTRDEDAFYGLMRDQPELRAWQMQQQERERGRCVGMSGLEFGGTSLSLMDQRFMPSPPLSASPGSPHGASSTTGHHWTFEEQFKQLYELSDDTNRKEFLDDLFSFMQKRGTPVNRIPIMAKQTLDLYELFQLVVSKEGLVEVINKKLWREITKGLNLPSSITSAAFTLRTQYMKYLYPYECEKLKLSTLSELQYAVDGNRREGRRPSYGSEYSPLPSMMPVAQNMTRLHEGLAAMAAVRSSMGLSPKEKDGPMHRQPSHPQLLLPPTANQLRTLAECDAEAVKVATRAMAEVTKRMEEASRAAAVHAATVRLSTAVGPSAGSLHGPAPNNLTLNGPMQKSDEPLAKRPALDENRLGPTPPGPMQPLHKSGVSAAHIKLTSRGDGHSEMDSSIVASMEINGIMYQGVLFAQHQHLMERA